MMPKKTDKRVFKLVYLDKKGRRCTTFMDVYSIMSVEDVTDKIAGWEEMGKNLIKKPKKADMEWAIGTIKALKARGE